ncbi:MAG: aminopeptidase [Gemmataceae bacterium]|jgi:Xaa-Pro aminopeptidase|uniref:Aminopeptidase P family protein n=1 Tax=Thermogemmata fonticola TaxID=2755323 RepID=A0A7V9AAH3_9BACT|nr:Xaa-Pro peptidase family protein [Thermogemmata fonticola]MBA2225111.1 aminopeptidase P family protein [Thermogemmata fonticola]GIW84433.1 MAG: aminopeptidase [Gemmataceae bacterium]
MLTPEGCRRRRERLVNHLGWKTPVVLADPIHLRYLAGFHVEAIHQHADFGAILVLFPNGDGRLYYDSRLPGASAQVEQHEALVWYDGQSPGRGPRRLIFEPILNQYGGRIHDALTDPQAREIHTAISQLRRAKDEDELEMIRRCLRATEAGHAWARQHLQAGMTELEVYSGVTQAVYQFLGHWAVVYGDFVAAKGKKRGGPPTNYRLQRGDTFILDYSVVLGGYRSDCTNTLCVGSVPPRQQELYEACLEAIRAGESALRPGATGQHVYHAVRDAFRRRGLEAFFTTHAGHGLGLMHPEPPFFVPHSTEVLQVGDVVTLEPGLYCDDCGMRFEHVYRITETGCERLSEHTLALACTSSQ